MLSARKLTLSFQVTPNTIWFSQEFYLSLHYMTDIDKEAQELLYEYVKALIPIEVFEDGDEAIKALYKSVVESPFSRQQAKRCLLVGLNRQIEDALMYDDCLEEVPLDFLEAKFGKQAAEEYDKWYNKWGDKYLHLVKLREAVNNLL